MIINVKCMPSKMFHILIFLIIINQISGLSYNRPKFCPNATWNATAITFLDQHKIGEKPVALFINSNNTVYVFSLLLKRVQGWFEGGMTSTSTNLDDISYPKSIFVATNDDIYIVANHVNGKVEKVSLNTTERVPVMILNGYCADLFIDIEDNLYCSEQADHKIIKTSLNNGMNTTIVAGNGFFGNETNQLNMPRGIFVNMKLDLYVADSRNHRIQLFRSGQKNAETIVIKGLEPPLNEPHGIVLDADDYLFIVDEENGRIIGQGPNGFQCVVGCRIPGSGPNNLKKPSFLRFDSFGNIFVTDTANHRIQKFSLKNNFCDQTVTHQKEIFRDQTTANQMTISTDQITTNEMTLSTDQTTTSPIKSSTDAYASNSKLFILTILALVQFWF